MTHVKMKFIRAIALSGFLCIVSSGAQSAEESKQTSGEREQGANPAQEKRDVGAESQLNTTALPKAEIVSVDATTWAEVRSGCLTETPPGEDDAPGRLLTVRIGNEMLRLFVTQGRSIRCEDSALKDDKPKNVPLDPTLEPVVGQARDDLAERLDIEPAKVEVSEAQWVTWRDSSAGCPQDGNVYMQVLTPGARIRLKVSGTEYYYHQIGRAAPFLCERPSGIEPLPGPETS